MIDAGQLPARKAGSRVLIRATDLERWFLNLPPAGMATEPLTIDSSTSTSTRW
jgi:hypothetical protein